MIVDANIIVANYVADHPGATRAARLFARGAVSAPPIWATEMLSALLKYVRHRGLSTEMAVIAHMEACHELETVSQADPRLILGLSLGSRCSVYDCEYVASAMIHEMPLFTFDKDLIKAFPKVAREP